MKKSVFLQQALILFLSLSGFSLATLFLTNYTWREKFDEADTRLLLVIYGHRSAFLAQLLDFVAGPWFWGAICLFLVTFLFRHYGRGAALLVAVALLLPVLAYAVTTGIIKPYFGRLSPVVRLNAVYPGTVKQEALYSFVSAKAAAAFALAVFIRLALGERERFVKYMVASYATLVCADRLYSGLHYPGDVLGSLVFGCLLAYLAYMVYYVLNDHLPLTS